MKCQYIRDDMEVSPAYVTKPEWQDLIVVKNIMRDGRIRPVPFFKNGAIVESPQAFRSVQMGVAIPADEACALRCNMTVEDMGKAQYAYERLVRRIDPDDFDIYDAGVITGYDENGEFVPGPNWHRLSEFRTVEAEAPDEDEGI